jgi:hypothetical protein
MSFGDNTGDKEIQNGFDVFLSGYIANDITVYISSNDVTISGKLLDVYKDGIVIESSMMKKTIFISKSSISYVEIKKKK